MNVPLEIPLGARKGSTDLLILSLVDEEDLHGYEIGRRIWVLGSLSAVSRELRATALPFMQGLSATTGENVHIAVLDGDRALYIDRISGRRAVPVVSKPGARLPLHATGVSKPGARLPLHATGVGKVLLAYGGEEVREQAVQRLRRLTPLTVVDSRRLERQLQQVVEQGYATTHEEMTPGSSSLAVPVFDRDERVVAALGLVTASTRRELTRLIPAVQLAGRGISRMLGSTR